MFNRNRTKRHDAYNVNLIFTHDSKPNFERKKDIWDKFSAVSTLLSGILIAGIGVYFSHIYQSQNSLEKIRLAKVEIVQKMLPYIIESEETKANALVTISELGSTSLSVRLAMLNPGSGSTKAIAEILSEKSDLLSETLEKKALFGLKNMLAVPAHSIVSIKYEKNTLYGFRMSDKGLFVFRTPLGFSDEALFGKPITSDDGLQVRLSNIGCCDASGKTQLFHVGLLDGSPQSKLKGLFPADLKTLAVGDMVWFEPYHKNVPSLIAKVNSISKDIIRIETVYPKNAKVSAGALLDMQGLLVGFNFENDEQGEFIPFIHEDLQ